MSDIRKLVNKIIADKVISKEERDILTRAMWKDGEVDEAEKAEIDRIFDLLRLGEIKKDFL